MPAQTADRWLALSPYLDEALTLSPDARGPWLADLRVHDPSLADELERLLAERDVLSRGGFLDRGLAGGLPLAEPVCGARIGPYTLSSMLGRGGMGTVWLAERSDGRYAGRVAIKLLNAALTGPSGEARFIREGTILARLTHPHVAHLIDAGVTGAGQPYLVLEYVEGEHIDVYCDRAGLDVAARVRLFVDVLDAVAHAHANLIVHRDLKPSNVLVRADGTVKLLDFGIATLLADQHGLSATATSEGMAALTPAWAAPEQVLGQPITTATDVHALGLLLYVLLGGPHPVLQHRGTPIDVLKAIVENEPPRLSTVAPRGAALRGDLEAIVAKALRKDPAGRYASASALADDLRRYLSREPVTARRNTVGYRAATFMRRHARGLAVAAMVLLLLVSGAAVSARRLATERDRARVEAARASRTASLITSLMTASDPYATRDREPTLRDVLGRGATQVRRELADEPGLRADLLTVIGRVHLRRGQYADAEPLLEDAVATLRAVSPEGSSAHAQALNDLGVLRREQGNVGAAIPLLEQALAMRTRVLGARHVDVAVTQVELGRALEDANRFDEAEGLYRSALDLRRALLGERHRETATSLTELGLLSRQRGDLDAAERHLRRALDITRAVLPADHPNVSSGWNNLGLVLLDRGDYAGAEPLLRRALAIREQQFGAGHASLAITVGNLSVAVREQGRPDEALRLADAAIASTRAARGPEHPTLAGLLFKRGNALLALGRHTEAEVTFRDTLRRQEALLRADDWRRAATVSALAAARHAQGAHREAEALLVEATAALHDGVGAQGRESTLARRRLTSVRAALAAASSLNPRTSR